MSNSTLSGNSANVGFSSGGGAIHNNGGTVTVSSNSTLSGNSVTDVDYGHGGGIAFINGGSFTLQNTIVANSPSGGNCYAVGGSITDSGYNLDSDGSCGFGTANHSLSGTWDNPLNPQLGALADNGGPTMTHALLAGSPALNTIPQGTNGCGGLILNTDQRGVSRPQGSACDTGSFERVYVAPPAISVVAGSASNSACLAANRGGVTLILSDADSDVNALTLSATSSNTTLVPTSNITFGGTGANRTATITTVSGLTGTSNLKIKVSDGQKSSTVLVTVQAGGSAKNTISGTTGADLLLGQGGADTLDGLGSGDVLCGGGGNDSLRGGSGADTLDRGSGTDRATDYSAAQGDARLNIP